jgi:hypothetical protein
MLREMLRDFSGLRDLATNPLKSLEAGTGIEPVFTDLQSVRFAQ